MQKMPPKSHPAMATKDMMPYIDGLSAPAGTEFKADIAIVGAGAGGGSLAYHLVEQGFNVVLFDAGPLWATNTFSTDMGKAYARMYADNGMRTTDIPPLMPIFNAEGLGGSTLVNSGLCFRPRPAVLQEWKENAGVDWIDAASMAEHYDWVEDYMMVAPGQEFALGRNNTILREAAAKLGWRAGVAPRNAPTCIGCGACNVGCPSGGKRSVDVSYIRDAALAGLTVVCNARAQTIERAKDGRVTRIKGVFMNSRKRPRPAAFTVEADYFVLAAGALNTPAMLLQNGFDNPKIGRHMHAHPGVGVSAHVYREHINQWDGITQGFYVDEFMEQGVLIETAAVQVAAVSAAFTPVGAAGNAAIRDFKHVTTIGGMIHDTGEGRIRRLWGGRIIRSYDPSRDDIEKLKFTLHRVADLCEAMEADTYHPTMVGVAPFKTRAAYNQAVDSVRSAEQLMLYISHPHGTCRMHVDVKEGVTDQDFRVHGTPNLYIGDASVFCDTLGVNPQITIMALSRKLAQIMAQTVK